MSDIVEVLEDLIKDPSVDVALSPVFFAVKKELKRKDAEIERLRKGLQRIERWFGEFPQTDRFWDDDKTHPMSYAAAWGSNGERDFMRAIARAALTASETEIQLEK